MMSLTGLPSGTISVSTMMGSSLLGPPRIGSPFSSTRISWAAAPGYSGYSNFQFHFIALTFTSMASAGGEDRRMKSISPHTKKIRRKTAGMALHRNSSLPLWVSGLVRSESPRRLYFCMK